MRDLVVSSMPVPPTVDKDQHGVTISGDGGAHLRVSRLNIAECSGGIEHITALLVAAARGAASIIPPPRYHS